MRVKLVHGMNSINCANNVLPTFVKRWRDGQMVLRWIAVSLNQASRGFRTIRGYRDMKRLAAALAKAVLFVSDDKVKVA